MYKNFIFLVKCIFKKYLLTDDFDYRKMDARNFETINNILRSLSLMLSLLKGRNAPIWRSVNREISTVHEPRDSYKNLL